MNTFPRWYVDFHRDNKGKDQYNKYDAENDTTMSFQLMPLDGTCTIPHDAQEQSQQQFVDPTSNEELWWPRDLQTLQMRPSLDVFVKGGIPSLVMAGMQIRVPPGASMDGKEWRNFGRNSQPLASLWTSFSMAVEKGFRVETFYGRNLLEQNQNDGMEHVLDWKHVGEQQNDDEDEDEIGAVAREERLFQSTRGTQRAVEWMGKLLANLEDESPLLEGMHIVSIPVHEEWWDLPKIIQGGEGDDGYKLVSVATVESDARAVLKMGKDIMIMSGSSLLSVDVSNIAAGGESKYIPDVYLPLYNKQAIK